MRAIILSTCFIFFFSTVFTQSISKIEPPFWWVGMQNENLQLMIYGDDIGDLKVEINHKGVEVEKVHCVDSKNYLFVDLIIDKSAKAGEFEIKLNSENKTLAKYTYELKQRIPNSSQRKGFGTSDVLYLITPDRFANGTTANDSIENLREGYNRTKPYGRHGGDIQGLIDNLDYISDMGFSAIWLNPVLENDQDAWSYHGYATTDYYKVDPRFGSNEDYIRLSELATEKGIGIIMDIIVNHCGSFHPWMEDPPTKDWINYFNEPMTFTNHRKTTLVDPYTSDRDREIMTNGWFVEAMPDLNQNNAFMSTYLIQNSIWWIEYANLYGIRQDTYSYPFRQFMTDWTCAIQNEYPNFNIVGEEWVEDPAIISYWQQGKQNHDGYTSCLPSLMDFPLCFAVHKALRDKEEWGNGLIKIYELLASDYLYSDPFNLVIFPDNHDMSRIFTQLNEDLDHLKMAITFILTTRGIPQIYYGTEILMANPGTESHGIIRSDFPGGWEGDTKNAFTGEGMSEREIATQEWFKKIIQWRNSTSLIHDGKLMHFEPKDGIYTFFRYNDSESIMIVLNKNGESSELSLDRFEERLQDFKTAVNPLTDESITLESSITIPAKSAQILVLSK